MNRGILISLLVVAVAATAAVLFFPGGDPQPLDPLVVDGGGDNPDSQQPTEAELGPGGVRTASSGADEVKNLDADPTTIVGVVRAADTGKPLPKARVVYAHRQFGGEAAGWNSSAVRSIGQHCDSKARFKMPSAGRHDALAIVAWAPGYSVTRYSGLNLGDVVEIDLMPSVKVKGSVVDPQGRPAAQTKVKLFDPSHGMDGYPMTVVTDENGDFQVSATHQDGVSLEVRSGAGTALLDRSVNVRQGMEPLHVVLGGNLSLQGQVTDEGGAPIGGAMLTLSPKGQRSKTEAVSDEEGQILIYGLEAGEWNCTISASGFATQKQEFTIFRGSPTTLQVALTRNSSLQVTAVDGKGRPLQGAILQLIADPNGDYRHLKFPKTATDADGVAVFAQVPPGTYAVGPEAVAGQSMTILFESEGGKAGGKGTAGFSSLIDILPGQDSQMELVLKRHGVLTVTVRRNGKPIDGARGKLIEVGTNKKREREANDLSNLNGELVFPAVWMGEYILEVQGSPSEVAVRRELTCGRGVNSFEVDLPGGSISGLVTANGQPVVDAELSVAMSGQAFTSMALTSADGRFHVQGFEAGNYQLRIESAQHLSWELPDLQHDGGQVDLGNIELDTSCRLAGKVTGLKPSAKDFIGPIIHALDLQGNGLATRPINSNGTFVFESLPAGSVQLRIVVSGRDLHSQTVQLPLAEESLLIEL